MYLLDTDVVSLLDVRRHQFAPEFLPWMRRNGPHLFLSVITLAELEAGVLKVLREGKEKRFVAYAALRDAIQETFGARILPVDASVALAAPRMADALLPRIIAAMDLMIAATAQVHGLTVLTRNLRHFQPTGVPCIDPLIELPPDVPR